MPRTTRPDRSDAAHHLAMRNTVGDREANQSPRPPNASLNEIIAAVCREFGVDEAQLAGTGRQRRISEARAVAALFIVNTPSIHLSMAATRLGRAECTLTSAARRLRARASRDASLNQRLLHLWHSLTSPRSVCVNSGTTLRTILDTGGPLPFRLSLDIVRELVVPLLQQEPGGPRYREITPEWVQVDEQWRPRILMPHERSPARRDGVAASYQGPEVRDEAEPAPASLVWSLGALLFEMVTGRRLGASGESTSDTAPGVRTLVPGIPERVELLIYRMLERDPDLRIGSVEAVGRELETIANELRREEAGGVAARVVPKETETPPSTVAGRDTCTPFVGREREISEIASLIADPWHRLITVLGPGGVGKSRLAFEVAQKTASAFRDGAVMVPLSAVRAPAFIPLAIGQAVGLTFMGKETVETQLLRFLGDKEILLVLDDFDRLVEGARVVAALIGAAPGMKVMVTSRERLNLHIERVYELGGLDVPVEEETALAIDYGAVGLFQESARRIRREFMITERNAASVVRICRSLDGMPLAIELATGWVRTLACDQIEREVEQSLDVLTTIEKDVPERHRSMRAVFDRSWRFLATAEQRVLARLSVFQGGFDRYAAAAVAGATLPVLASLIDKSLVTRDPFGRYRLHELWRQYLADQLAKSSSQLLETETLHAAYYAGFLWEKGPILEKEDDRRTLDAAVDEFGNIRRAWDWAVVNNEVDVLARMLTPFVRMHLLSGWYQQIEDTLGRASVHLKEALRTQDSDAAHTSALLGRVLCEQGSLITNRGEYPLARVCLEESIQVLRPHGEVDHLADALSCLAHVASREGNYDEAELLGEEALTLSTSVSSTHVESRALDILGTTAMYRGDYARAQSLHQRCLERAQTIGNTRMVAVVLNNLGNDAYCQGHLDAAFESYRQAVELNRTTGYKPSLRTALGNLGNVALMLGKYSEAQELYRESLQVAREIGTDHGMAHALYQMGVVAFEQDDFEEAERLHRESLAIHRRTGERRGQGLTLTALGRVLQARHQVEDAQRCYRESEQLFRDIGERWGLADTLSTLGAACLELGDRRKGREALREALLLALDIKVDRLMLEACEGYGKLLDALGEDAACVRIFRMLATHPAAGQRTKQYATERLPRVSARLSKRELESIEEQCRTLTLDGLAKEILADDRC